jgi:hypothetical protein
MQKSKNRCKHPKIDAKVAKIDAKVAKIDAKVDQNYPNSNRCKSRLKPRVE